LGPAGRRAWSLARGEENRSIAPRKPATAIHETLEFPEAVGNELTLRRGLGVLLDRLLARPERAGRPPRKIAVWARLVGGASWRRTVTLREPTADAARLRLALAPKLQELPAPALKLRLEVGELAEHTGEQLELLGTGGLGTEGEAGRARLREGLRQVRAAVGAGGVSTVVEVAPWSRIPEARALLVPRDD
jgi:protein ImuB